MSLALHEALSRDVYKTKTELARLMGCTTREVEQRVEHARKTSQLPVMSGPDGYRLARSADEYDYNVQRRRKRALTQLVTNRGEREYLRRWRNDPPKPVKPPKPKPAESEPLWGAL